MRLIRGRSVRHVLLIATLLVPAAATSQTDDTTERALRLDQTVQSLKDELVELTREAQAVEAAVVTPEHHRVSVYLGVAVRGLLLEEVTVAIDDRPPEVYHYDARDARALLAEHSLQRILRGVVAPGPHRIRLAFRGRFADDKADAPPATDSYEAIFDKDHREAELEFAITRARGFGGAPRLSMKQWKRQR